MAEKLTHIANALRQARRRAGLSQRQLAVVSDVSRPTIAALELGKYENIQSSTLAKLAEALEVSPNELIAPVDNDAMRIFDDFMASPLAKMLKISEREQDILRVMQNNWNAGPPTFETFFFLIEAIRHSGNHDR